LLDIYKPCEFLYNVENLIVCCEIPEEGLLGCTLVVSTVGVFTLAGVVTAIIPLVALVIQFVLVDTQVWRERGVILQNKSTS
jgi:hypothetical protein